MIKAKIERHKGDALWLFVDRVEGRQTTADDLKGIFGLRDEDEGNVAYPIMEGEVEAIRDACNEWLAKRKTS